MTALDGFDQDAYNAACQALSGRYNGDIHDTAEHITRILQAQQERYGPRYMLHLTQSFTARSSIVTQLAGMAEAAGVRGGAAPYWRASVRWDGGAVEHGIETSSLVRPDGTQGQR